MQQESQAYKAQVVAIAEGQASRFEQLEQAYSQAPEVTRKRLYIETVENLLTRAHKVLIDSKAGGGAGGNMFYLPLDKLIEKSGGRGDESSLESGSSPQGKEPDSVTVEARARGDR
jgi:membrane protease subunit HflK